MKKFFVLLASLMIFLPAVVSAKITDFGPFLLAPNLPTTNTLGNIKVAISKNKWAFSYSNGKAVFIKTNSGLLGPYNKVKDIVLTDDLSVFVYSEEKGDYLKINNKIYGPFSSYLDFASNGKQWGFSYLSDNNVYFVINNKQYGPYEKSVYNMQFGSEYDFRKTLAFSKDKWAISYYQGGKRFINLNGKIYGPYDPGSTRTLILLDDDWAFDYYLNGKFYLMQSDVLSAPYSNAPTTYVYANKIISKLSSGGGWARELYACALSNNSYLSLLDGVKTPDEKNCLMSYISSSGGYYVDVNKTPYGPYSWILSSAVSGDNWMFGYIGNDRLEGYVNVNGKIYGPFEKNNGSIDMSTTKKNWIFSYAKDGKLYYKINWIIYQEEKAIVMSGTDLIVLLEHTGKEKNVQDQKDTMEKYTKPLVKSDKKIKTSEIYAINNFIVYGTLSNMSLPMSDRVTMVIKFKNSNKRLPKTEKDWLSILKVSK